jgi:methionyl-tRNA formyltransferase
VNLHFSLLPEYRGAAPVQRAIIEGKSETGVSMMVLTEGMDEGPVIAVQTASIEPTESAGALGERLAVIGAEMLPDALRGFVSGDVEPQPQDDAAATYAAKIADEEARIDWTRPIAEISCLVRGCDPNPGAWTNFRGRRLKVHGLEAADGAAGSPGELVPGPDLLVGTGDGVARLGEVQPAGKRRMAGAELARGLRVASGERFE